MFQYRRSVFTFILKLRAVWYSMIALLEQEHMVKLQIELWLTSIKAFLPPHTQTCSHPHHSSEEIISGLQAFFNSLYGYSLLLAAADVSDLYVITCIHSRNISPDKRHTLCSCISPSPRFRGRKVCVICIQLGTLKPVPIQLSPGFLSHLFLCTCYS